MGLIESQYKDFLPDGHNRQWEEAHVAILEANQQFTEETGKSPTFTQIAEVTGLHINTVYRHYRAMKMDRDIKPRFQKNVFEVLNRHLELMRQNDDKRVALQAVLALEERLFDLIPRTEIAVQDVQQKKLTIEIEDRRKALVPAEEVVVDVEHEVVVDEDKSST